MSKYITVSLGVLCFVWVSANIHIVHRFPPLFYHLMQNPTKEDAVVFLKKLKHQKEFDQQLQILTSLFGKSLIDQVQTASLERKKTIILLHELLKKNEKAKEVLVSLSILYHEEDDINSSRFYYDKAKNLDPELYIKELETL